jgi:hypothetical protein
MTEPFFSDAEVKLLRQVLANISVNPSAPDAVVICEAVQGILSKLSVYDASPAFDGASESMDGGEASASDCAQPADAN